MLVTEKHLINYFTECSIGGTVFNEKEFKKKLGAYVHGLLMNGVSDLIQGLDVHIQSVVEDREFDDYVPSFDEMIKAAAVTLGISVADVLGDKRNSANVTARTLVCDYCKRHELDLTLTEIGRALGGRDHSTIIHNQRKAKNLRESEDENYLHHWRVFKRNLKRVVGNKW